MTMRLSRMGGIVLGCLLGLGALAVAQPVKAGTFVCYQYAIVGDPITGIIGHSGDGLAQWESNGDVNNPSSTLPLYMNMISASAIATSGSPVDNASMQTVESNDCSTFLAVEVAWIPDPNALPGTDPAPAQLKLGYKKRLTSIIGTEVKYTDYFGTAHASAASLVTFENEDSTGELSIELNAPDGDGEYYDSQTLTDSGYQYVILNTSSGTARTLLPVTWSMGVYESCDRSRTEDDVASATTVAKFSIDSVTMEIM